MTAFSTLFAPIMTPTMTKWLAGSYIPVDFWNMLFTIIKMVIIPIGSGLIVHSFLEKMGKVHHIYARIYEIIMFALPKLSMFVIAFACAIMTANARDKLLVGTIVFSVVISVIVHNFLGLVLGYYGARVTGLGERECRTIAIEVGLQNSGMAAGLALEVLKSELASVPGVVYSSWHNITGAILASYWRRKKLNK
jgi:BASS family bile acid:Na+ symporter